MCRSGLEAEQQDIERARDPVVMVGGRRHGPLMITYLEAGEVVADTVTDRDCLFLAGLYRAEQAIAERLRVLSSGRLPWSKIDADKGIPWVEARTGLTLAESQWTASSWRCASRCW